MPSFSFWLVFADTLITVPAVLYILFYPREPKAMLAWILAFIFLPGLGVLLFIFIGEPRLRRIQRRRRRRRQKLQIQETHSAKSLPTLPPAMRQIADLAARISRQTPAGGNTLSLFHDGRRGLDALERAMRAASSHIHLEYYIFTPDSTGRRFARLLMEKARDGVECRLLVDFIGSWAWSNRLFREMKRAGVQVGFFLPVLPWRGRWRVNFRNHRKIAVIDGRIGFTGSQNIGDLYAGVDKSYTEWHDTHMRLQGPVVGDLQEIFAEDWHYAVRKALGRRYFPEIPACGATTVQLAPSGPDMDARVVQVLLLTMFAAAKQDICIITPYFVPDSAVVLALQTAAYRGIKVRILIPRRTDQHLSKWAGRSYYAELCAAGVEICEYGAGMLHSKVIVIDSRWSMVGSANMDERSFKLNFELSVLIYDGSAAAELLYKFSKLRAQSKIYRRPEQLPWRGGSRFLLGLARLASPLL